MVAIHATASIDTCPNPTHDVTHSETVGFHSLSTERTAYSPRVEGTIPAWLSGTLIRNGPGKFEVDGRRVNHWFDGLAMLRRYSFADGNVEYTNRFLRTDAYADAMAGRLTGQFGTDTRSWRRIFETIRSFGLPEPTDNTNVHVANIDGEYVALTEAPQRVAFDPETLDTRGSFEFEDEIPEQITAAHLVDDPHREELVGFTTEFGLQPQYHIYRIPRGSRRRRLISSVDARGPAYIHDCSVTDKHAILVESPLRLSVLRALNPFSEGAIDLLNWEPSMPTRILVVDRSTGALVADPTFEATFCFHHVNAYLEAGDIVLDLIEFPNSEIVGSLSLDALDGQGFPDVPVGRLMRYRIDPAANTVDRSQQYAGGMELPRVVQATVGRRHRYAYGQATDRSGANGLVKVDCDTGVATEWWEDGCYVEEPIPVQRPDGEAEDDGVVLAPVLDINREQTQLVVFDAATLTVEARVYLPHAEPFGFHGRFFPEL